MITQEETSSPLSPVLPTRNDDNDNDDDEETFASDNIQTQTTSPSAGTVVDDDDMTEINVDGDGTISGMQNASRIDRIIDDIGQIWTPVSSCFLPSSTLNFELSFLSYHTFIS